MDEWWEKIKMGVQDMNPITVFCWNLLKRSKVFQYWYARHLSELLFDLQLIGFERKQIERKYQAKLDKLKERKPYE